MLFMIVLNITLFFCIYIFYIELVLETIFIFNSSFKQFQFLHLTRIFNTLNSSFKISGIPRVLYKRVQSSILTNSFQEGRFFI